MFCVSVLVFFCCLCAPSFSKPQIHCCNGYDRRICDALLHFNYIEIGTSVEKVHTLYSFKIDSIQFDSISAKERALRRSDKKYTETENRLQLHINCFSMLLIRDFSLPLWRIFISPKTSIKAPILVYRLFCRLTCFTASWFS